MTHLENYIFDSLDDDSKEEPYEDYILKNQLDSGKKYETE